MLTTYLKINLKNSRYVDHCIAQQGGVIIQATLDEGKDLERCPNPFKPEEGINPFDIWHRITGSWPQGEIDFSVKPRINHSGEGIGAIKDYFSIIYAPSKNILKIGSLRGVLAQAQIQNPVYVPNIESLKQGIEHFFRGCLRGLDAPKGDIERITLMAQERLPHDAFAPRDIQVG